MERKASKSNEFCCALGCNSLARRNRDVSFHYFPKHNARKVTVLNTSGVTEKADLRKLWELKLRHGKPITKYMRVCSLHFTEEDYRTVGMSKGVRKRLCKTAVPSLKLPKISSSQKVKLGEPRMNLLEINKVAEYSTSKKVQIECAPETYSREEIEAADILCLMARQSRLKMFRAQVDKTKPTQHIKTATICCV